MVAFVGMTFGVARGVERLRQRDVEDLLLERHQNTQNLQSDRGAGLHAEELRHIRLLEAASSQMVAEALGAITNHPRAPGQPVGQILKAGGDVRAAGEDAVDDLGVGDGEENFRDDILNAVELGVLDDERREATRLTGGNPRAGSCSWRRCPRPIGSLTLRFSG